MKTLKLSNAKLTYYERGTAASMVIRRITQVFQMVPRISQERPQATQVAEIHWKTSETAEPAM